MLYILNHINIAALTVFPPIHQTGEPQAFEYDVDGLKDETSTLKPIYCTLTQN